MKASGTLCEYKMVGCCLLTPKCCPSIVWEFLHLITRLPSPAYGTFVSPLKMMKKSSGEMVYSGQVLEKSPVGGIWLHCDSHSRHREEPSPRATETWALAPSLGPLNPDSEGGGARSHQVPPTSGQAVPRLQDQVPTAARGPPSPAQAMLRHQEAQHLLLGAGPLCSRVCPNKTQVGKPETKKDPGEGGTFKIAVD